MIFRRCLPDLCSLPDLCPPISCSGSPNCCVVQRTLFETEVRVSQSGPICSSRAMDGGVGCLKLRCRWERRSDSREKSRSAYRSRRPRPRPCLSSTVFHIVAKMNTALDEVGAGESRRMASEGRTPLLKKSRWLLPEPESTHDSFWRVKFSPGSAVAAPPKRGWPAGRRAAHAREPSLHHSRSTRNKSSRR